MFFDTLRKRVLFFASRVPEKAIEAAHIAHYVHRIIMTPVNFGLIPFLRSTSCLQIRFAGRTIDNSNLLYSSGFVLIIYLIQGK